MPERILYIHPGWSKTGTSAIQNALHHARSELLARGILYPESLQWKDHAHHDFALAFKPPAGVYRTKLQPQEALDRLEAELVSSGAHSVIISSELSPVYFREPSFRAYAEKRFDDVRLVFTIRRQSELLLSLFAQLVRDPNVRYAHSLFYLFVQNIHWMNFHARVAEWETHVSPSHISLLTYGDSILARFLALFSLTEPADSTPRVHSSLPPRALLAIQRRCRGIATPAAYTRQRDAVLEALQNTDPASDKHILFSAPEQAAVDAHYSASNQQLAAKYTLDQPLFGQTQYSPIKAAS